MWRLSHAGDVRGRTLGWGSAGAPGRRRACWDGAAGRRKGEAGRGERMGGGQEWCGKGGGARGAKGVQAGRKGRRYGG